MRSWLSPPTRRELTLLLFCVTIFVIAYNLDASLEVVGLPRRQALLLGPDGRRLPAHRDALEDMIFGDWDWDEGRIAGVKAAEEARIKGTAHGKGWSTGAGVSSDDRYVRGEGVTGSNAFWLQGISAGEFVTADGLGATTINDGFVRWGDHIPRTQVVVHTPGFTVLDNAFMVNGTMFVVTDDLSSVPTVDALGSSLVDHSQPPKPIDWEILTGEVALQRLGPYGGRLHGVTFMSYDNVSDGHTILSLQRLYSTLNMSSTEPLPPPLRLLLADIFTFCDQKPADGDSAVPRSRCSLGMHPFLLKAAYPTLAGALSADDLNDFAQMGTPIVFDRIAVADRAAAMRHGALRGWEPPFTHLHAPDGWFEPVRTALAGVLGEHERPPQKSHEITYLVHQGAIQRQVPADHEKLPDSGLRLEQQSHEALISELKGLKDVGVHIIHEDAPWSQRMAAIVRSTITISVHGDHLSDCVFMRASQQTTLVELFPSGSFSRDWEIVVQSMGMHYVAWQNEQKIDAAALPPVSLPSDSQTIFIDAKQVVRAIREILSD